MRSSVFIAAGAVVMLLLGLLHLAYTFRGPKLSSSRRRRYGEDDGRFTRDQPTNDHVAGMGWLQPKP